MWGSEPERWSEREMERERERERETESERERERETVSERALSEISLIGRAVVTTFELFP